MRLTASKVLHRFDEGMVQALIELGQAQITSFRSIQDIVTIHQEPTSFADELSSLPLSGYEPRPTSVKAIFECFLEGSGVPSLQLDADVGLSNLAADLKEDLDDRGARSWLLLLAATGSRAPVLSTNVTVCLSATFFVSPSDSQPKNYFGRLHSPLGAAGGKEMQVVSHGDGEPAMVGLLFLSTHLRLLSGAPRV